VDKYLEYLTRYTLRERSFSESERLEFFYSLDEMLTGQETNVIVDQTNNDRLASPYSGCLEETSSASSFGSFLFRETFKTMKVYTIRRAA
jgi:hypothetical protein